MITIRAKAISRSPAASFARSPILLGNGLITTLLEGPFCTIGGSKTAFGGRRGHGKGRLSNRLLVVFARRAAIALRMNLHGGFTLSEHRAIGPFQQPTTIK